MPWNSTSPVGNISVKANRTIQQQNTTYTEVTMGNSIIGTNTNTTRDHFWNVGANEDGRHRFINSPAFTVGAVPADPLVGAGMDAVLYLKTTNAQPQWFNKTSAGVIYQVSPNFLSGSLAVNASFSTIVALPSDVYGEIFMYTTANGRRSGQAGFFKTTGGTCEAWAYGLRIQGSSTAGYALKFGNGSDASGLNLRVATEDAANGLTWNYRITYRAV